MVIALCIILSTIVGFCLGRLDRETEKKPRDEKVARLGNGGYVRTQPPSTPRPDTLKISKKALKSWRK